MKASGWEEPIALDALETTMRDHLLARCAAATRPPASRPAGAGPRTSRAATPQLRAGDREVAGR